MLDQFSDKYANLAVSIALAAMVALSLFLFTPIDIYLSNHDEFITPLSEIIVSLIAPASIVFLLLALFAFTVKTSSQSQYLGLLCALAFLLWLQSKVLLWEYGVLNGEPIEWSMADWRGWFDITIWAAVIVIFTFFINNRKILVQFVSVLFVVQLVTAGFNVTARWDELNSGFTGNQAELDNYYEFSSEHNVVHILLDGFQGDIFNDLAYNQDFGEQFRDLMPGFVFYRQTLGIFPYTRFALPALLSGRIYANRETKDDFVDATFQGETILNTAYEQGYEVDIASEEYWAQRYALGKHHNSIVIPANFNDLGGGHSRRNAAQIIDLSLFRAVPHFLKQFIYNDQAWLVQSLGGVPEAAFRYFSHQRFMMDIIDNMKVSRSEPVYKLLHVMNVHNPMVVKEDCSFAGGAVGTTRYTLTLQSFCTMQIVLSLFERMRELGVYDSSLIIIHADHGGWTNVEGYNGMRLSNGSTLSPDIMSLATPLLAIKQPGADQPFAASKAPVSLVDIPDTIADIMGWEENFGHRSVLSVNPDENRMRRFYFYSWQRDAWETDHTGPIQEFIIDGRHVESIWRFGEVFEPPASP